MVHSQVRYQNSWPIVSISIVFWLEIIGCIMSINSKAGTSWTRPRKYFILTTHFPTSCRFPSDRSSSIFISSSSGCIGIATPASTSTPTEPKKNYSSSTLGLRKFLFLLSGMQPPLISMEAWWSLLTSASMITPSSVSTKAEKIGAPSWGLLTSVTREARRRLKSNQ